MRERHAQEQQGKNGTGIMMHSSSEVRAAQQQRCGGSMAAARRAASVLLRVHFRYTSAILRLYFRYTLDILNGYLRKIKSKALREFLVKMCNKYLPESISRSSLQALQGSAWTMYGGMYIILFMCVLTYLIARTKENKRS